MSKQDAVAGEIVSALRNAGAIVRFVEFAHGIAGCPDVLVGYGGTTWLLELKGKRGRLSEAQQKFHAEWLGRGGPIAVVRSIPEAFVAIGLEPPF